jgi:hypothetical protein
MADSTKPNNVLCDTCINKNCIYSSSISQVSSIIIFSISLFVLLIGFYYSANKIFPFNSSNKLNIMFVIAIYVCSSAFILFHTVRIYLSMLKMDSDEKFCKNFVKSLTKNQRKIDWTIRLIITLILLFFLALNPIVSDKLLMVPFFYWPTLIYLLLLIWDILMAIFVKMNKKNNIVFGNDYKKERRSFLVNDLCGICLYTFFSLIEGKTITDDVLMFIIVFVIALVTIPLCRSIFIDLKNNYWNYFKSLKPTSSCIIEG